MSMFYIQTVFLLLLIFMLGLLLGRFLKTIWCRENATADSNGGFVDKEEQQYSSYARSADKLAARSTTRDFAAGMGAVATTAAVASSSSREVGKAVNQELRVRGIESTNLQAIEGIGPTMESVLHQNKIFDWVSLASTSAEEITEMLGEEYSGSADPASWIKQAELILAGEFDELFTLQSVEDGTSKFKRMMED